MKSVFAMAAAVALLAGCSTVNEWAAIGGSRADGTVRLGYSLGPFQSAKVQESQAVATAAAKCKTWGYTGAEAFGGEIRQCTASNGYGCVAYNVTKEYQCTGLGDKDPANAP